MKLDETPLLQPSNSRLCRTTGDRGGLNHRKCTNGCQKRVLGGQEVVHWQPFRGEFDILHQTIVWAWSRSPHSVKSRGGV